MRDTGEDGIAKVLRANGVHLEQLSMVGWPDWAWVYRGLLGFLEVKRKPGKGEKKAAMTRAQVNWHERLERHGILVPVAQTPEEALECIRQLADPKNFVPLETAPLRTYRDFPWEGYTAEQKARRLALSPHRTGSTMAAGPDTSTP